MRDATIADVLEGRARWCVVTGDCLAVLPTIPNGAVGAVVTDPPYGIGYRSGHDGCVAREIVGDETTEVRDFVINRGGTMAVFATWRCVPPVRPRGCLVWAKNAGGMGDLSFPWRPDFEMVWVFGEGWSGYRGTSVLTASTVCTWNTGPARRVHPHEKPVDLMEQIIAKAPEGIILDPFCGSGTTGVAAIKTGRRFIGIEIDEGYATIARRRIAEAADTLWTPPPPRTPDAELFKD